MEFDALKKIFVDQLYCEEDKVTMDARIVEDLEADSLAMVELVMAIEEAASITVPDEDIASLKTVGDVMNYVNGKA